MHRAKLQHSKISLSAGKGCWADLEIHKELAVTCVEFLTINYIMLCLVMNFFRRKTRII